MSLTIFTGFCVFVYSCVLFGTYFFLQWFGEAEKYVKAVFTLASKISPSVIFIDEVWLHWNFRTSMHLNIIRFAVSISVALVALVQVGPF
jgi:hypothetical protein